MKRIWEIVVTGGPCAGKTTGLSVLEQVISKQGYKVITVPETATEVISSGIFPGEIPVEDFQNVIIKRSINKEETTREVAKVFKEDVVILYDRGLLDNKAYMPYPLFLKLLKQQGLTETEARDRYDAVFHLVTAAEGAEEYYTLANNQARSETAEQARALDKITRDAWIGHQHLRVIDNSTPFKEKIDRLLKEVFVVLGLPTPIKTERKFLIKKPTEALLRKYGSIEIDIVQTYLKRIDESVERAIRKRGTNGDFSYFYTERRTLSSCSRFATIRKISKQEYRNLLAEKISSVTKKRHCFFYKNQYFELDIYPDWPELNDKAILEIELTDEKQELVIPFDLEVIEDVTGNEDFLNANLAK